jgi:FAD:protein FMN transferase
MIHNRRWNASLFCLLISLLLIVSGCGVSSAGGGASASVEAKSQTYFIFDTVVTVKVFDNKVTDKNFEEIGGLLEKIDREMSRTKETSEIYAVNRQAGKKAVPVSEETFDLVARAKSFGDLSGGRFDPTVGGLVDLWQIGKEGAHVPADADIQQLLKLINYKDIQLNDSDHSIYLAKEGMELDLGAIAKGYAGDVMADYLRSQGFESAIIDLGGNILAMGSKPGGADWTIGIQDPNPEIERGNSIGAVKVVNKTVVSSGVYERFFVENGVHYHHILDTATGYPVDNGLVSVTIITDNSANADGLSTSTFSMGLEKGMALVESLDNTEAIFITKDNEVYVSSGLKDFKVTSSKYKRVD